VKKGLLLIFLLFCGFVAINLLLVRFDSFRLSFAPVSTSRAYDGLTSIDFSFFGKNGPDKSYITQGYGATPYSYLYADHWHDGIDIAAAYGSSIHAATGGTVRAIGDQDDYCYHRGFGKYVAVKDDNGNFVLWYAHLGTTNVTPGARIAQGAVIGAVGTTGYETGTHLHFSVFDSDGFSMQNRNGCGPDPTGKDLDPIPFLETI
jgi:murein DD-endopeptidase MepM/ murein hydrolase activator NlpD